MRAVFRSRTRRSIVVTALSSLVLCGCAAGSSSTDDAKEKVTIALTADPGSLDPANADTVPAAGLVTAMYDTLVRINPKDNSVIPGLASSWKQTASSVEFKIRDGVTCSDGAKLAPSDIAKSLTRLVAPETKSRIPAALFPGMQLTATADDAKDSVTVSLDRPWSDLLPELAQASTGIVCPAGLKDPKALETKSFGTGPFVLTGAKQGQSYELKSRDDYDWGRDESVERPARLVYQIVENETTLVNLLQSKDVDSAVLGGADVSRLKDVDGMELRDEVVGTAFLQFNESDSRPLKDKALRRAIIQAIDKDAFASAAFGDRGETLSTISAANAPCADPDTASGSPAFDADEAKKVLADAKLKLKIVGTTQVGGGAGTEYVRAALENAGVDATLDNVDTNTWAQTLFAGGGDWDVTVMAVADPASLRLPASHFAGPPPPAGRNVPGMVDPAFESAFATATQTTGDESCAAWTKAQKALIDGDHTLPLATLPSVLALAEGVSAQAFAGVILGDTISVGK